MMGKDRPIGSAAMLLSVLVHGSLLGIPVSWEKLRKSPPPNIASVPVIQLVPTPASSPPQQLPALTRQPVQRLPKQPRRINFPRQLRQRPPQPRRSPIPRPIVSPSVKPTPLVKPTPITEPKISSSPSPSPSPSTQSSPVISPISTPPSTPSPTEELLNPTEIAQSFQTVVDSFKVGEAGITYSLDEVMLYFGQKNQSSLLLISPEEPQPGIITYQQFSEKTVAQVRKEQVQAKLKKQQFTIDKLALTDDAPAVAGEVWHMRRGSFQRYLQIMPLNQPSETLLVIWGQPPPFVIAPAAPAKK